MVPSERDVHELNAVPSGRDVHAKVNPELLAVSNEGALSLNEADDLFLIELSPMSTFRM